MFRQRINDGCALFLCLTAHDSGAVGQASALLASVHGAEMSEKAGKESLDTSRDERWIGMPFLGFCLALRRPSIITALDGRLNLSMQRLDSQCREKDVAHEAQDQDPHSVTAFDRSFPPVAVGARAA